MNRRNLFQLILAAFFAPPEIFKKTPAETEFFAALEEFVKECCSSGTAAPDLIICSPATYEWVKSKISLDIPS